MKRFDLQRCALRCSMLVPFLCASIAQGTLVAHYKFDEEAGATTAVNAITTNGGDGAIGANVGVGAPGKIGNAVKLNNDATQAGVVDMANATGVFSKILASGKLTISYWLNSSDVSANRSVAVFMGNSADSNDYIDSGILGGTQANPPAPNGSAYGRSRVNTDATANIGDLFGTLINDGAFHHLALTVDTASATGSFYVDGVLISADINPAKFSAFPMFNNLEVGRLGRSSPVDPIDGFVDDLQIYDRVLNASEISSLFTNPGSVVPEPSAIVSLTVGIGLAALRRRRAA
jgi:hypothetical protein